MLTDKGWHNKKGILNGYDYNKFGPSSYSTLLPCSGRTWTASTDVSEVDSTLTRIFDLKECFSLCLGSRYLRRLPGYNGVWTCCSGFSIQ